MKEILENNKVKESMTRLSKSKKLREYEFKSCR